MRAAVCRPSPAVPARRTRRRPRPPDAAPGGRPPPPPAAGRPPVPAAGPRPSRPVPPLPSGQVPPLHPSAAPFLPADVEPGVRPSRPVAPLPPLPGRRPSPAGQPERHVAGFAHRAARRATATPGRRRTTRVVLGVVAVVALYHLGLYVY